MSVCRAAAAASYMTDNTTAFTSSPGSTGWQSMCAVRVSVCVCVTATTMNVETGAASSDDARWFLC